MKKFETQVCFVSGQPDANLLPLMCDVFQSDKVILLATQQMKARAQDLKDAVKDDVQVQVVPLDSAYDMNALERQLTQWKENGLIKPQETVMNITGGTKLMSITCYRWCVNNGVSAFYMSVDDGTLTLFLGNKSEDLETQAVKVHGSEPVLKRYLRAHGFKLLEASQPEVSDARQSFIDFAMREDRSDFIGTLNAWASKAAEIWKDRKARDLSRKTIRVRLDSRDSGYEFVKYAQEQGNGLNNWVGVSSGTAEFYGTYAEDTKENIDFLKGFWFEQAVADALREAFPDAEVYQNVKVKANNGQGAGNELDAVFFYKNRLCVVEAKTCNYEKEDNDAQNYLHKLGSVANDVGGNAARSCFISYRELPDSLIKRAKDKHVEVIHGKDLFERSVLIEKLKKWAN